MPARPWYGVLIYEPLGFVSLIMILVGVRRHRPARRRIWYCIAAGQALWVLGDVTFDFYDYVLHRSPFPSLADVFYLAGYPVLMAGLFILVRGRTAGRDRAGLIDAAVIATGLGLVCWAFFMRPIVQDDSLSPVTAVISLAYPVMDVVMIAMIARLFTGPGARTPSYRFLMAGAVLLTGSDIFFSALNAFFTYDGGATDAGFLLSYLLWGAAALHPSMRSLSEPATDHVARLSRVRLALLAAASLLAPCLLLIQGLHDPRHVDWVASGVGAVVLFLLVLVRMSGLVTLVQEQATQDELTRLGNRRLLHREVERALAELAPDQVQLALIDLDDFKTVNDRLGYHVGDQLLTAVAGRLTEATAPGTVLVRLGGDEFAVLLAPATQPEADAVVREVAEALRQPMCADGHDLLIRASIGVADAADTQEPRELLRRADVAMYAAKDNGKQRVARYHLEMDLHSVEEVRLGAQLRHAIDASEMHLVYQPIVELPDGRMVGVEALVRWQHPQHGLVSPGLFIPVAERNGLIVTLGEWILREACQQAARWQNGPGSQHLRRISVNVSARQLREPDFAATVAGILRATGLEPERLVVEVTETAVFDGGAALESVWALHRLGVTIALDDFGTGHSSLGLLRTCPANILKVDKSFVDEVGGGSDQDVIATALIQIAGGLRLDAIAEGVESAGQADHLHRIGYRYAQGFHFARPVPAAEITELLRAEAAGSLVVP
nr:bifunctional diguanylate cyclase/phosphodiesterase [Planosporangium thailandense]